MALEGIARRLHFKRQAFSDTFLSRDGSPAPGGPGIVLAHLRAFCRANKSSVVVGANGMIDPLATAMAEGRREVWLELQRYLNMDETTLHNLSVDVATQMGERLVSE